MNEELRCQQEELGESNLQLEKVSRTKSDFLANMSHELRTPLNSVIGFSEVLQDQLFGPMNEKQKEYVGNILSSGRHLLSLINDILDLAKIESGKMELELDVFSLRETLEIALVMLKEKALKGRVTMHLELSPGCEFILADQRKLKQIMFNLLSNAVKFTPPGGRVQVTARRMSDQTDQSDPTDRSDRIEITVTDSGVGIKEEYLALLFTPFTQLEPAYTKEYEGTGLGLALARNLVELHGGTIRVQSVYGAGSSFSFTIPMTAEAVAAIPVEKGTTVNNADKTILMIEDDHHQQASLGSALQQKGYRVLKATTGEAGVTMARRELPDLVILDLMLPGINGFDVVDLLKDEAALLNVPVLLLTAMDLTSEDRRQMAKNIWRVVEKGSLSTGELLSLVESAFRSDEMEGVCYGAENSHR